VSGPEIKAESNSKHVNTSPFLVKNLRTTAPGQSALLLLDVIDLLNKHNISYAVIGAFAASFHGLVRASLDADAAISARTPKITDGLCRDLRESGLDVQRRTGGPGDPIAGVINIQDRFHNRVDLLSGIRGVGQETFDRSVETQFMGSSIKIASLEDFIAMKIFAGGPKDIQDIIGILEVSHEKINGSLLKQLTSRYGKECAIKLGEVLKQYPFLSTE